MRSYLCGALLVIVWLSSISSAVADSYGSYFGRVVTEWQGDGRGMKLLEPFAYLDPTGIRWEAPSGWVVDGASIPKLAWSIIGGPFEGKYRDASVIHDVACDQKLRAWPSVHKAFYTAMLASGVDAVKAKVMYAAVYHFGPRWEKRVSILNVPLSEVHARIAPLHEAAFIGEKVDVQISPKQGSGCPPGFSCMMAPPKKADVVVVFRPDNTELKPEDFVRLKALIETADVSLEAIEAFKP